MQTIVARLPPDANFKIGVTRQPSFRFLRTQRWGYFEQGYRGLHVVWRGAASWMAEGERQLIDLYRGKDDRCRNSNTGGEMCHSDGVGRFFYVAMARKGLGNERRLPFIMRLRRECLDIPYIAARGGRLVGDRELCTAAAALIIRQWPFINFGG